MSMKYVMIYNDWPERTRRLSAADKGRLVDALMAYARGEDPEPLLQGNEQFLFDDLRLQYDRDREQYERKCQQRVDAVEARWNAVRNEKQATAEERTSHGETETDTPAAPSRAQAEKPTAAVSSLAAGADVYLRNTSDTTVYSRNTDDTTVYSRNTSDTDVSCRIQEEEKEKDKDEEKDKDTTTSSPVIPFPEQAETEKEEKDTYQSSLLEKLRNGTREGAITSADRPGRGDDGAHADETGPAADGTHDEENSKVADIITAKKNAWVAARGERNAEDPVYRERSAGKAEDAGRGETTAKPARTTSPSVAVTHPVKEEEKETNERESDLSASGTEEARPGEAAKRSGRAHPPLPPVFHDDLIASIKAMGQERPAPDDKPEEKSEGKPAENRDGTVSDIQAVERHTALTAGHEGKTTPATAHEGQITPATNHDGYVDSAASYEEKTAPAMAHEGKTASAAKHEGHAVPAAAHEGKTVPGEGHEGHTAAVEDYEEHPSTTTSHEERTASKAGHEWHAATPANHEENAVSTTEHEEKASIAVDHEGKTAPVAAHEGKSSISDHEEQTVTDADHEEKTSPDAGHEGHTSASADQEEKPASAAIPSSFEAWLALSEIALPQDEPPADGSSPGGAGLRVNEVSVSSDSCSLTGNSAGPAGGSASALPRNFAELCRAANLPCEAEHQRMAEALARQYSADWLADAMLLAGFERRTANWRYVAGVLRNAKQRGYVSLNLPNRDPAPASYRDASSPFRGPYDPPQPAGYDPGREYGSRRDHDDEEISHVLNRVWRMAMEEAEKEKEGAKTRDGG